jgi:hypothetical protein
LTSKALTPVVIGFFSVLYVGTAFTVEDALMALIKVVASSLPLIALFALIPLNRALLLLKEVYDFIVRRRLTRSGIGIVTPELFDETVSLPEVTDGYSRVKLRLADSGYTTRGDAHWLGAWRGFSVFPARALFLAASACLFCGILLSLGGRESYRANVIEGVAFPGRDGEASGGVVQRIALERSAGSFLSKTLSIEVAPTKEGEEKQVFGLYPPSRYLGAFVYPRYVGLGLHYRLRSPGMLQGYEARSVLNIYPPGKEESRSIEGSPYRLVFSLATSPDGSDPYLTGLFKVEFKLLKGDALLFSGSAPPGGAFVKDGYKVEIEEVRRAVVTDFISDSGVYLVWLAAVLYILSFVIWLLVRTLFPLREMVFITGKGKITASSRNEGRGRSHASLFHEVLDAAVCLESEPVE